MLLKSSSWSFKILVSFEPAIESPQITIKSGDGAYFLDDFNKLFKTFLFIPLSFPLVSAVNISDIYYIVLIIFT